MSYDARHRLLLLLLSSALAVLVVAGCGSEEAGSSSGAGGATESAEPQTVGSCPVDSPEVTSARTVARADLDGDGTLEAVRLTAPGGDCPNLLFAEVGPTYVTGSLPAGTPALSGAFAVEVPGRDEALVVTRQDHPRGGFQLRVFAAGEKELVELQVDEHALVPFVALDVDEHPLSVECADGGVVVTEAVPHEPPGVMFAWDIRQTTYAVDGTEVTTESSVEIADNVLPGQLESKYPDLVSRSAFESCRAEG
jgi:hypothetical protein